MADWKHSMEPTTEKPNLFHPIANILSVNHLNWKIFEVVNHVNWNKKASGVKEGLLCWKLIFEVIHLNWNGKW